MGAEQQSHDRSKFSPRPRNTSVEDLEARNAASLDNLLRGLLPPQDRARLIRGSRIIAPPRGPIESVKPRKEISPEMRRYMAGVDPLPGSFVDEVLAKVFEREPDETGPDYARKVNRTLYKVGAIRRELIRHMHTDGLSLPDAAAKLGLSMSEQALQRNYNQSILKLAEHLNIHLTA